MKILFINLTLEFKQIVKHPKHTLAPLDIGYCASLLDKESHVTEFIDTAIKKYSFDNLISQIKKEKPDILVIKPFINLKDITLKIALELKKNVKNIFLIGPFATTCYDEFIFKNTPITACIINESEYTLLEIVKKLSKKESIKNIKGIVYYDKKLVKTSARDLIKTLDKLPFPKHEFFVNEGYYFYFPVNIKKKVKIGYMLSSRGCPYNCIFCSPIERASFGKNYRDRSAKNIVDEMELLQNKRVNTIYFIDDLFLLNNHRVSKICDEIIKRKLQVKWIVQSRIDTIDVSLLEKLKDSGCSTILCGIESGENKILKKLNKETNTNKIRQVINEIHKSGILTVGSFIIGSPGETKKNILKTIEFAKSIPLDMVEALFFTPYPGSLAFQKYRLKKVENYTKFCTDCNPSDISKEELTKLQKYFYRSYYLRPKFLIEYLYNNFIFLMLNFNQQRNLIMKTIKYLFSH